MCAWVPWGRVYRVGLSVVWAPEYGVCAYIPGVCVGIVCVPEYCVCA